MRFASWRQRRRFIEAVRLLLHISRSECFIEKITDLWYNYQKGCDIMANDKLTEQSIEFAVHIINLVSGSMFYEGTVAEIKITKTNSET